MPAIHLWTVVMEIVILCLEYVSPYARSSFQDGNHDYKLIIYTLQAY